MHRYVRHLCTGSLAALTVIVSSAAAERIPIPDGIFYYAPAASVFGSEAVWTDPAALGHYKATEFEIMLDYRDGTFARSWGGVINRQGFALAQRYLDNPDGNNFREYILAYGVPFGRSLALGGSYRYFSRGPGIYSNRHFWNLAVTSTGVGPFSWAAVFSNLNRGEVNGRKTETEQRYSLSYRPSGQTVTFSVDAFLSTKQRFKNGEFVYHAQFDPVPGLTVNGYVDSHKNFEIGVRANLAGFFVGSQQVYSRHVSLKRHTIYVGATAARQPSLIPEKRRRLSLNVNGRPQENPTEFVFGQAPPAYTDILLSMYRAADDPSIGEMVLSLNRLSVGFAQAQELRDAITAFRSRGKRVTCYVTSPGNVSYYVASAADKIVIPPVSQLNLVGLRAELTFYAGTMEKLGIKADILRIGKYKTAAEAFTRETPSEANVEMTNRLLDDIYAQFVGGIAEGRGISADSVRALIDMGPFTSAQAIEYGLVDGLSYRDELKDNKLLRSMPEISFRSYEKDTLLNSGWPWLPEIAVVVGDGEIVTGSGSPVPFDEGAKMTPALMSRGFSQARADADVRGIVFRIDSPGGLALAGEDIYHDATKAAKHVPMTVSMGDMAASGAYYIAMAGGSLFASPGSVTGSIGIFGGKADLSGLYDKIDLRKTLYTRGKYAGMLTLTRPFTEDERQKYYDQLNAFYQHFVQLVADNREIAPDSIDALARGRVWTGREALANGLVDHLGGLKAALDHTARKLDLHEYRVVRYPQRRAWFQLPSMPLFGGLISTLAGHRDVSTAVHEAVPLDDGDIYARLPFDLDIQ